ncbi:hypothetical protein SAMN05444392_106136 [Seinonella peptonophila]|uniref:Uncharacterized protein n=1 Tax=Seinonella peptonophila TaxID=112248 RepID=A0A1M4YBC3_9BACL|nr:hypothetical protein [Seinonella peptonophila]SHF02802.1 hypothetical protein SAMN05444392_106136 [Seinonella peptonophila]
MLSLSKWYREVFTNQRKQAGLQDNLPSTMIHYTPNAHVIDPDWKNSFYRLQTGNLDAVISSSKTGKQLQVTYDPYSDLFVFTINGKLLSK